ncbi:type VI secretion system secreted protein VgrG [Pseudoalteromonas ulvae UL12]|uniref:type VI secretion system tip protein TssI/VgrG n=1 Tax=Pseudoalteromonas ulvae TaxID=107327 RepID=UPI00186B8035|nr:type VI secretion system tip protein TssI/VgrG [Pseudoalteromonas ulvae]MBE0366085.1 type VI secretion system secreted protein VgrG [Pseudoalteromonas ulvae UL12]
MSRYTFSFQCQGFATDSFDLHAFEGIEALSQLFQFNLTLSSTNLELDADVAINKDATLIIYFNGQEIRQVNGLLSCFEETEYLVDKTLYKATLVPTAWTLAKFETNEIYLDQTIKETIAMIMEDAGILATHYRFDLSREYRKWPFRLQYKETHLSFIQRIILREGIYFYFENNQSHSVIVFTDNLQSLKTLEHSPLNFQPATSLDASTQFNRCHNLICKRNSLPKKVTLRDFNEESPSLDVRGEVEIDSNGIGDINIFGLNILSPEEGEALATIHANAFKCRKKEYIGEGEDALMCPGLSFDLCHHPRAALNEEHYLIEQVTHHGINGMMLNHSDDQQNIYSNSFIALSKQFEYAPHYVDCKPEIKGTLNAVIDAESSGEYAELDSFGRYRVKFPFDRKDREGGKASYWLRMMQPYGGTNEGMHFPLRKGTRVLISFIGGDPDRPYITGAISDSAEQISIVKDANQTNSVIKTPSGNKIEFEDKQGKNRIKLESPTNNTYLHLGAPNHDGSGYVMVTNGVQRKVIKGGSNVSIQTSAYSGATNTDSSELYNSAKSYQAGDLVNFNGKPYKCLVNQTTAASPLTQASDWQNYIGYVPAFLFYEQDSNGKLVDTATPPVKLSYSKELDGAYIVSRTQGNQYNWSQGNQFNYFATGLGQTGLTEPSNQNKHFNFGTNWAVHCAYYYYDSSQTTLRGKSPEELIDETMNLFVANIIDYDSEAIMQVDAAETARNQQLAAAAQTIINNERFDNYNQTLLSTFQQIESTPLYSSRSEAESAFYNTIKQQWLDPILAKEADLNARILEGKHISIDEEKYTLKKELTTKASKMAQTMAQDHLHQYIGEKYFLRSGWRSTESILESSNAMLTKLKDKTKERVANALKVMAIWQRYLSYSRVRVAHHDSLNIQKGNIYDFGGYWNYNLGNSYTENHMSQTTKINEIKDHDLLKVGGPYWGTMTNPADDFSHVSKPSMNWRYVDNVWVEKTFSGKSYEYTFEKESIEVNHKCKTLEISHGCASHELKFNGKGVKVFESKSGGGISEEWMSTPDGNFATYSKTDLSGAGKKTEDRVYAYEAPVSYEIVNKPAPGTAFSFKGDGLPTFSTSLVIDVGSTSIATHLGVMSNSVSIEAMGMSNAIKIDGTLMANTVKISETVLETNVKIGIGGMTAKAEIGGEAIGTYLSQKALDIKKEDAIKLHNDTIAIVLKQMEIERKALEIGSGDLKLTSAMLNLIA